MGLDNAICVKRNEYTSNIPELKQFEKDWEVKYGYDFEIAYYRKCYNVKYMVFRCVEKTRDNDRSDPLDINDIDNIIKGLQSFNSENWQDDWGSIWDWDDEEWPYSAKVQRDIENLKILKELM